MKKGRKLKIFLIVLAVIIAVLVGVAVWQWPNIKAVIYFMNYSQEDLDEMYKSNQEELDNALEGFGDIKPRDLTEDEKKALESGMITEEEAVEISLGKTTLEDIIKKKSEGELPGNEEPETDVPGGGKDKNKEVGGGNGSADKTVASVESQYGDKVAGLIAQLYVLKSSYLSKLDGLEAEGKAEYAKTPKEKRTSAWKGSMISKYTARISAWEGECDAAVEGIISKIRQELLKNGGDTSIIQTIRSTYENEKQIKKASYLNKYMK